MRITKEIEKLETFPTQWGMLRADIWCTQEAKRINHERTKLRMQGIDNPLRVIVRETEKECWIEELETRKTLLSDYHQEP